MIATDRLLDYFESIGISFFSGVPDSLLQAFCVSLYFRYGEGNESHIVAVNEGNAVALGAGYHLATGKIPLVYMQNSGLGNAINPITSLADPTIYGIPIIYLVGWRGEPGTHDEPQHVKQGLITCPLLDMLDIKYFVIDKNSTLESLIHEFNTKLYPDIENGKSVAIVVCKGSFEKPMGKLPFFNADLSREEVIKRIVNVTGTNDYIISTTGKISRELYEYRNDSSTSFKGHDFLTVGSMGHASTIAFSIALKKKDKRIWCLDGDGALLMHMGSLAIIGSIKPKNLIHIVLNNSSHESVGGLPTVAGKIDLLNIAKAVGYTKICRIHNSQELNHFLQDNNSNTDGPLFVEIIVSSGSRENLIRPDTTPVENKISFMSSLQKV